MTTNDPSQRGHFEPRTGRFFRELRRNPGMQLSHSIGQPAARPSASKALLSWFWLGVLLEFIGGPLAVTQWPGQTYVSDPELGNYWQSTGDTGGAIAGLMLASAGSAMVLVAIIGWGVLYGIRASRESN